MPKPVQLDADSQAVYDAIRNHIAQHGFAPDYREIAQQCGFRTWSKIGEHLKSLQDAGLIIYRPGSPRAIALIGKSR